MATHASIRPAGPQLVVSRAGTSQHGSSWCRYAMAAVLSAVLLGAAPAVAVCVGDCNNNTVVTVDEIITGINIALGNTPLSSCPSFDSSGNGLVTVDELLHGVSNALNGCGAPLPGNAQAKITVVNRSGSQQTLTLHGSLKIPHTPPASYDSSYTVPNVVVPASCSCSCGGTCCSGGACRCDGPSGLPACDVTVGNTAPGLAPGEWVHDISVTATGQIQYQRDLLVSGTPPNPASWTVFKTALKVNLYANDNGDGTCSDGSCTLRDAILEGNTTLQQPVLIMFDAGVFPAVPAKLTSPPANEMQVTQPVNHEQEGLNITANGLVIDGTDPEGNPSILHPMADRIYSRWIRLNLAQNQDVEHNGSFIITAPNASLVGLRIQRVQPTGNPPPPTPNFTSKNIDAVDFYAPATNSSVLTCQIDGGAGDKYQSSTGRDCIETLGAGSGGTAADFSQANLVQQTEIKNCWDKAIKSSGSGGNGTPFLRVEDSWIHDTIDTGVQATLSGAVSIKRSLVERCGFHSGTPTPAAGSANGIAANGAYMPSTPTPGYVPTPAVLISEANVSRSNTLRNFFVRNASRATLTNDYACGAVGATSNGITVDNPNPPATPVVSITGTASALNPLSGLAINNSATVATGGPNNAFTKNSASARNVNNGSTVGVTISQTQWEHCGNGTSCVLSDIQSFDINSTAKVTVSSPQAHRTPGSFTFAPTPIIPSKVAKVGDVVHITGSGFNAIEGYNAYQPGTNGCPAGGGVCPAATDCATLDVGNTCTPYVKGTCVEFWDTVAQTWKAADDILGVTPTELVVTSPIACSAQTHVRVRRLNELGNPVTSNEVPFCVNP